MPAIPARKIHTVVDRDNLSTKPNIVMEAVDELVDFLKVTLGPKIQHILVDSGFRTELMDDGVSIAEEFECEDEFKDAVVAYVREAAKKTDDAAGDGTTSTMVVLRRLLALLLASGKKYPEVRAELEKAALEAVQQLKERSVTISSLEDLVKVAKTSMNDDEAAQVVAEVVHKTGAKGAVTITDALGRGVSYEKLEGFTMGRGFINRGMINEPETNMFLAPNKDFGGRVAIAVSEASITSPDDLLPILRAAEEAQTKNLVIFCPNMLAAALYVCGVHKATGRFNVAAVSLPGQGEKMKDYVQDICTVSGATLAVGEFAAANLGYADQVRVSVDDTTIIGGHGDKTLIEGVIAHLQNRSDESKDDYEKEYLHQRQARLMGGVVMIKVGGVTETEVRLRLKKVEDAVNACKCALEEGVSPGAGAALLRINTSSEMLNEALYEVNAQVLMNAEIEADLDVDALRQTVDVMTGKTGDFLDEVGVVDSTKVLRTVIENAVSIATILFSTAGIITSKRQEPTNSK